MYQSALSAAETAEALYVKECGELGVETIVDTWIDDSGLAIDAGTRSKLAEVLSEALNERAIAEWAAKLVGNPDFETWYGDQQ